MYPIVCRDGSKRNLVNHLEERGIETRDMMPITNQPVYANMLGNLDGQYPIAEWINSNGFYIGCHQDLTQDQLDHVIDSFKSYYKRS
jgi:dTDP-4-amino-4,6-dideoxygalactose transaminase